MATTAYNAFSNFVKSFRTNKGTKGDKNITHTSMGRPKGAFNIPDPKLPEFFNLYATAIQTGNTLHFIERHNGNDQVLIDVDLQYNDLNRKYTTNHIETICTTYISNIIQMAHKENICVKNDVLKAYVFERDHPYKKSTGECKDGIHIMIKGILMNEHAHYALRDACIEDRNMMNAIESLDICDKDLGNILDQSVIKNNGWFMYQSTKPDLNPYKLTGIYVCTSVNKDSFGITRDDEELKKTLGLPIETIVKLFSIRNNMENNTETIKITYDISKYEDVFMFRKNHYDPSIDRECIEDLLRIMKPERAEHYDTWIRIGWALHNISADKEMLSLWKLYSTQSDKYRDVNNWEKLWEDMRDEGVGIGSIHYWARNDNPEEYKIIKAKHNPNAYFWKDKMMTYNSIDDCLRLNHVGHARMFAYFFEEIIAYYDKTWYVWNEDLWLIEDRNMIGNLFSDRMEIIINDYIAHLEKINDDKKIIDKRIVILRNYLEKKICCSNYIEGVLKRLQPQVEERDFNNMIDQNPNIFNMNNYAIELTTGEYRKRCIDDYATMKTDIDYNPCLTNDDCPTFIKFITEITRRYPETGVDATIIDEYNEQIVSFMQRLLGYSLYGHNKEQCMLIVYGNGSNGKGVLMRLMKKIFGVFYEDVHEDAIMKKKFETKGGATPYLAQLMDARLACLSEIDETQILDENIVKRMTGEDSILCRQLYKQQTSFVAKFFLILFTNNKPKINESDQAIWRRIILMSFKMRYFSENDIHLMDANNPYHKLKDYDLEDRLENEIPAIMNWLIEGARLWHESKWKVPQLVLDEINEYKSDQSPIVDFISERCENKVGAKTSFADIYDAYQSWCEENEYEACSANQFSRTFGKMYEKYKSMSVRGFRGVRLKTSKIV